MLWQLTLNGIAVAALYALVGIGFALEYNVTKFFNFTHGAFFTVGAYSALAFSNQAHLPLFLSVILAIPFAAICGAAIYILLYRPLRRNGATELVLLLASLGSYVVIQNVISVIFGDQITALNQGNSTQNFVLAGAVLNSIQLTSIVAAVIVVSAATFLLRSTKIGRAIRAISSNEQLASLCGVDTERVALVAFSIASALAGLAGILSGLDVDLTPTMGLTPLMMGIVAVIAGGRGSMVGVALGAMLVGISENLGISQIDSRWQSAIAFVILLLFLFLRPNGLAKARSRDITV